MMLNTRFEIVFKAGVKTAVYHRGQQGYLRACGMG